MLGIWETLLLRIMQVSRTDRGALDGFGSDIVGATIGRALDGNPIGTEHVVTKNPGATSVLNVDLNKCSNA